MIFGTKFWFNQWSSWALRTVNSDGGGTRQLVDPATSNSRMSVIPQISVRHKDYVASVSVMGRTTYSLSQSWTSATEANRSEVDANVGMYVSPGLVVSAGYKRLTQQFGGQFTWAGPTIGASATGSLSPGLASYMAVGLGAMKVTLGRADGALKTSLNSGYVLSEAGLAYSPQSASSAWLRKTAFTAGYRSQVLTTKGYTLSETSLATTKQDVRDSTQGFTLGMVVAF